MKKVLIALFALLSLCANAQRAAESQLGKITLSAYVQDDEATGDATRKALTDKLNQIATAHGCAGEGWESRFVITAHLVPVEESTTATVPVMTSVLLGVTIYVGDGQDGTLFSSCYAELQGVGESRDAAWKNAIRKINARNPELIAAIDKGKAKIGEYFASAGPSIIKKAQAAAQGQKFDEAVSILATIPSVCPQYAQAQNLLGQYTATIVDNSNLDIVSKARAAWAASPDESGAARAEAILDGIESPSPKVRQQIRALNDEVTSRLKAVADREFRFQKKLAAWEHEETINRQNNQRRIAVANARAVAKIASAYYNSRPRVVHHVHWW